MFKLCPSGEGWYCLLTGERGGVNGIALKRFPEQWVQENLGPLTNQVIRNEGAKFFLNPSKLLPIKAVGFLLLPWETAYSDAFLKMLCCPRSSLTNSLEEI